MSIAKQNKKSYLKSAGKVSGATALSRIFGLLREQVMAYFFGAGMATDAFVTAYRIPNLLRDMFAEGALSSAFVPVFKEKQVQQSNQAAFDLANLILSAILVVVGLIVVLGIIAAPLVIYLMAYGFVDTPEKFNLTVNMTQIMMAYLLLVSLSALVMGILNSFGKFGIPALSPAMFNIGVIVSVLALYSLFEQPAYTLAIGVIIGGIGQLAVQLPSLSKIGFRLKFKLSFLDEGVKKVIKLIGPMIIGLSAGRINIVISTLLASFLIEGALSYLNYSYRLMHLPLGMFAVALGTVALPKVSEMAARQDMDGLEKTLYQTINLNLLVVVPSAAFLAIAGQDIVRLIFQWGRFSETDAAFSAAALLHYSYGLIGFAAVRVIVPFYYALSDSKLPMKISIATVALNILLYYPLIKLLGFVGLAAATSISGLLNFALLVYFLPRKGISVSFSRISLYLVRTIVAAGLAFEAARMIPWHIFESDSILLYRIEAVIMQLIIGGLLYLGLCYLLGLRGIEMIRAKKGSGSE